MSTIGPTGEDPRRSGLGDELALASARPTVARASAALPVAAVALGVSLLGFGAFMWLSGQRTAREEAPITAAPPSRAMGQIAAAAPEPQPLPQAPPPVTYNIPAPQFTVSNVSPAAPNLPLPNIPGLAANPGDPAQRRHAPALVVDLSPARETTTAVPANPATAGGAPKAGAPGAAGADAAHSDISNEEKFAERISGPGEADRVSATTMHNLGTTIPQGAMIPGVLETALDSDLPGFARAVVSRDVRGFDGTTVLIPRGSRLIGQYKSGLALGSSRVFVIWSRVVRPDGVSIQIGSPGTDDLGRAGLTGKVDTHFFTRFGGSILLSVIDAGLASLSNNQPNAQIVIGSSTDATNVAAVALQKDINTPPTVKTPQGAPIRIFVAKDLDFSGVAAVKASATGALR